MTGGRIVVGASIRTLSGAADRLAVAWPQPRGFHQPHQKMPPRSLVLLGRAAFAGCAFLFAAHARAATATVNPGDSIQAALDAVAAAGGGTVYVNSGNYTLYSKCQIPDNVTLKGSGAKVILMARQGLTEDQAFQKMRSMAMNKNLKLADLAQRILDAEDLLG